LLEFNQHTANTMTFIHWKRCEKLESDNVKDKISWQLISHYIQEQYFDG